MATLHVRNVPDELYEALRGRAESQGRSIGSEVVAILAPFLARPLHLHAQPFHLGLPQSMQPPGESISPGERLTGLARSALARARAEAAGLGHEEIEAEHLLLALFGEGVAGRALETLGLPADDLREQIVRVRGRGQAPTTPTRLGDGAKRALEAALRESLSCGYTHVGTEQVLIGVASDTDGTGAQVLLEHGIDLACIRGAVVRVLSTPQGVALDFSPQYAVVELRGSADSWSEQLNARAVEGWELFALQTVGQKVRAVFKRGAMAV